MYELIYTSVPRGLLQGRSGYATVALTAGMPPNLILPVENLSGYTFTLRNGQFSSECNPVSCSYRKVRFGNMILRVASRIAPCGLDYSGRNNKIAHHLIFESDDEAGTLSGGAAELFLSGGNFRTEYTEEPRELPARRVRPAAVPIEPPARTWAEVTGDAGYAALIAAKLLAAGRRPFYVAYPAAVPAETLMKLLAEAAALLEPEDRRQFTFTTFFDREQPGEECFLRMVPDFSPALSNLRKFHQSELLDLCLPVPPLPPDFADNELVGIARHGRLEMIELASPEPPVLPEAPVPRPPARPESGGADGEPLHIPERRDFVGVRVPRTARPGPAATAQKRNLRPIPGHFPAESPSGQWSGRMQAAMLALVAAMLIFLLYLAFRPLPKPNEKTDNTPQPAAPERTVPEPIAAAGQKTPAAGQKQPETGSMQISTALQTATAPAADSAAPETTRSTAQAAARSAPATPRAAQGTSASAPQTDGAKAARPRRNLSDEEWHQAQPLWKSKTEPSMNWLKSWRDSLDRNKPVEMELPTIPKWDRFEVKIAGIGGRAVADAAVFVDCPAKLEVHIRSAVQEGDQLRPDPNPNAALKIVFDRARNKLKITPAEGAVRPRLSDLTEICFFHETSRTCYLWKPQFFKEYLVRIKPGGVVMDSEGQFTYQLSAGEKQWQKDIAIRVGELPAGKLPKLPLKEWNDTVEKLAELKTGLFLGENRKEFATAKNQLKILRQKVREELKKISPKFPELPQFTRFSADGQEQTVAPGEALRGVDWSQWITYELKSSH